jgi:hypothetical protein
MGKKELRKECKARGLDSEGKRKHMRKRLRSDDKAKGVAGGAAEEEGDDDEGEEAEEEEADDLRARARKCACALR